MLCPPLACNTTQTRFGIDSISRPIRSCGIPPFQLKSLLLFLQSLWRWLRLRTRRSKSFHKCSIGFKSGDLDGTGTTVTLWLAIKSTVARAVLKNFPTDVHCGKHLWCQNLISVSNGTKVARDVHQLSFFRRRIWLPTSSHFLRRDCRLQGRSSLRTSHSGVIDTCTAISYLQHES